MDLHRTFTYRKNLKVVVITNFCTHYRYKLFKLLAEEYGWDFYFFDDPKRTKEDIKHLKVYKIESKFNYLSTLRILIENLRKKYDIIIKCTNNKWSFLGSFIVAKLIKAKFIVWHSIWYHPKNLQYKLFSGLLLGILRNHTDAIVVYGEHGKKFLVEKGITPEKIFIAWQTVDNELYGRSISEEEIKLLKEKLAIPDNKKNILYVGRLLKLKGIEYLLEALKMLENFRNDFVFIVVGDGELRQTIETYCKENNIDYRLVGLVPYNELPVYYKIARVLVLPSITTKTFKEPWGLVVNEAFNQGCPAIVTDAVGAGVGGLVKDGINGFVIPERNAQELAKTITSILTDEVLYKKLSMNAKEEIKNWTYERQAQGFLDAVKYSLEEKTQ